MIPSGYEKIVFKGEDLSTEQTENGSATSAQVSLTVNSEVLVLVSFKLTQGGAGDYELSCQVKTPFEGWRSLEVSPYIETSKIEYLIEITHYVFLG